ncbi:Helix-turn-helix type 11 domain protein [Beutenbergia cavernae DSM 12333]|uniref:Helix-turn-helix type 11 domain protein n=1 Tax=Beutenbergia cavernae (strain ATCC BAA-8 / DSM 12333 / CCUG 43141 / JCM 11478 / NBRC 16432 / NCIMB 13614 / HKI 0122) TaxID=471853 RepID=C5C4M2_BEUC1|nr:WYL domain-containing protein [Beutenbergia cavernae]ACQ82146.1 Helix-turn-helix type 11 domain protein [Beutenbergia cavernae DSM 12333]
MNKTERLYALAEELRRVGRAGTTGPRLARELEVSERTVKRDIAALQQAGLPIWAQSGPGGGYVLAGSASLPPVNFTPSQAVAVAVALATVPPGGPFAVDAAAARRKIWDTLDDDAAARAQRLASRVWVDHGAEILSQSDTEPLAVAQSSSRERVTSGGVMQRATRHVRTLRAVEDSLATSRTLSLRYVDRRGAETQRRVEPIILAHTGGAWYLVAWDRLRDAVRWFRLNRVVRADVTAETYEPRPVEVIGTPPSEARPVV